MSIVDKLLGAITPPETEETRAKATSKAREAAEPGDWLSMALDHHGQIRSAFDRAREAATPEDRLAAFRALATVLNGHSLAEEVVLYPALAKNGEKAHAGLAYTEQTTAKMQMAELERIDPATDAWRDKLEHIRGAVLHHMFEEEGTWFLELKDKAPDQEFLTRRFAEEYRRYAFGVDSEAAATAEPRSFAGEVGEDLEVVGRNDAGPLQVGQGAQDEAERPL
jgi:hemerythrin superfamily protein